MNGDTLVVLMGNQVAGYLTRLADRRLRFDYDADYRARPEFRARARNSGARTTGGVSGGRG